MISFENFTTFSVVVVVIQIIFGVLRYIYENFYGPWFGKPVDYKSYGKWAIVTGATDGIGKEYAKQLAQKGVNIILISRTLSKLEAVAKEIRESFNVETAVIDVDFTSAEIYDKVKEKIQGKVIGTLVNNVGMSYSSLYNFLEIPEREKFIQDSINCNILSMSMMCSIILTQMVQRRRGIIINVGSMSSEVQCPCVTVYSATKAYMLKFSEDLSAEYEKDGIVLQTVLPGFVATNMIGLNTGTLMVPGAEVYVKAALKTVGFAKQTNAYLPHMLLQLWAKFCGFTVPSILRTVTLMIMRNHAEIYMKPTDIKTVKKISIEKVS